MKNADMPLFPLNGETLHAYCQRLQELGQEEMSIRKGASEHFGLSVNEMGEFFTEFREARLRHIRMLIEMEPNRTEFSLIKKVSKNLGISDEEATSLVISIGS